VGVKTGEVLQTIKPLGSHMLQRSQIELDQRQRRTLGLDLADESTEPSFERIGLWDVSLSPNWAALVAVA